MNIVRWFSKLWHMCCCCCCWGNDYSSDSREERKRDIQYIMQPSEDSSEFSFEGSESFSCSQDPVRGSSSKHKIDPYQAIEKRRLLTRIKSAPAIVSFRPIEFWTGLTNSRGIQPHGLASQRSCYAYKLQPQLYEEDGYSENSDAGGFLTHPTLGDLHFTISYDVNRKQLLVKVIQARELARPVYQDQSRQDQSHSNPYVKLCLLPDIKNSRQTSVKSKTQNPVYEEIFYFDLSPREAQRRTLLLKVKDFDKFTRHYVLGQVLLPLCDINFIKGVHLWRPLLPCHKDVPELGELLLSLNYLPSAGRLNVDILRAKQLLQTDLVGGAVPYVRVSLVLAGKLVKSKKTTYRKNTIDPMFGETLSFNVLAAELNEVSLVISVWDFNGGMVKDDFIGRIVLGKHGTGVHEITHWSKMLQAERTSIAQWHTLRSKEECDQVSLASRLVA